MAQHGRDSDFARALKSGRWEHLSPGIYIGAVPVAPVLPMLALGLVLVVAVLRVLPDGRFARVADKA